MQIEACYKRITLRLRSQFSLVLADHITSRQMIRNTHHNYNTLKRALTCHLDRFLYAIEGQDKEIGIK